MTTLKRLIAGALIVLLSACAPAEPDNQLLPVTGQIPAPDFSLSGLDGRMHQLSEYRGRVVVVNFWATWCPPCRREMPSMERGWQELRRHNIELLAVAVGEEREAVTEFLDRHPVTFPLLLDPESEMMDRWPVRALPTTFVIDAEGRFAYQALGEREWDDPGLLELIRNLARASSDPE